MRRGRSCGAPFNLPKLEWVVKVCAAERKFRILLPDGSTFLQLKTAGVWTPVALGKKSKHAHRTKIFMSLLGCFPPIFPARRVETQHKHTQKQMQ